MAIQLCNECGKEVSDKALSCPHCGALQGAEKKVGTQINKFLRSIFFSLVGLCVILYGVSWYLGSPDVEEPELPQLPIEVQFRDALLGNGLVLKVNNTSDKTFMAVAVLSNPTTQETKTYRMDIAPNSSNEIGHLEGWVLASGDNVRIVKDGFKSWEGIIP